MRWLLLCVVPLVVSAPACTDPDAAATRCATEATWHRGDRYTREPEAHCRFVSDSGDVLRRTCFEWSELAPSLGEIEAGCGDADRLVNDFEVDECEDGGAIYYSPKSGGVSRVGQRLGPFAATAEELETTIRDATASCHR